MLSLNRASFHEDMIRVVDRLPITEEYRRVRHLVLQQLEPDTIISDDDLAKVVTECPHLETAVLSAVPSTTDRTVVLLAQNAINLQVREEALVDSRSWRIEHVANPRHRGLTLVAASR
jgi:F-box and leucine-rich repeat protein GRR1